MKHTWSYIEEVKWEDDWFSKKHQGYWDNPVNQRNFLNKFAKENSIHSPEDWRKVYPHKMMKLGGGLIVKYNFDLYQMLKSVYPGNCPLLLK